MRLAAAFIAAVGFGGLATAAPPPPQVYPPDLPKTLGGYDFQQLYGPYYQRVSRGWEGALDQALAGDGSWGGRRLWARVVDSQIEDYDHGIVRKDVFECYCEGERWRDDARTNCAYRYRFATVPVPPIGDGPLAARIKENFRPAALVRALASVGVKPGSSLNFRNDGAVWQAFARHTDLTAFYALFVERHDVSSEQCPALGAFATRLGSLPVALAPADGRDSLDDPPAPHGIEVRARVQGRLQSGGTVTVEGTRPLYALLTPLWRAVEKCSPQGDRRPAVPK